MILDTFPRTALTFGPSPIQPLERLTRHLGGATLWAKREDVNSGLAFGGNKVRKLEYLAADALAQGADTLVSIGGVQSNHTRQVAAVAAHLGMRCVLVQESWVDWPDAVYDRVGNIQLSRIMGADVRLVQAGFGIGFKESWELALAEIRDAGGTPYAIPAMPNPRVTGAAPTPWTRIDVAPDGRTLTVYFWNGAAGCYGMQDVQVTVVDGLTTVTVYTGMLPEAVNRLCIEIAQLYKTVVVLDAPILGGGD